MGKRSAVGSKLGSLPHAMFVVASAAGEGACNLVQEPKILLEAVMHLRPSNRDKNSRMQFFLQLFVLD